MISSSGPTLICNRTVSETWEWQMKLFLTVLRAVWPDGLKAFLITFQISFQLVVQ